MAAVISPDVRWFPLLRQRKQIVFLTGEKRTDCVPLIAIKRYDYVPLTAIKRSDYVPLYNHKEGEGVQKKLDLRINGLISFGKDTYPLFTPSNFVLHQCSSLITLAKTSFGRGVTNPGNS